MGSDIWVKKHPYESHVNIQSFLKPSTGVWALVSSRYPELYVVSTIFSDVFMQRFTKMTFTVNSGLMI